ncbi:ABC transporter ATP-binding protein [Dongia sp.]|uniref:ABC transporter ATP-binding protein n=1 Tax=Dongia sp. TaxID=1977262 RepID=UPI0035B4FA20
MNMPAKNAVAIRHLVKKFGNVTAVDDVSLSVAEGEFLTFLGSSGSGKTTTLFIVAGFEDPSAGTVEIDGRSVLSVPPNERNIGMVFQRYTLFPHMSVRDNVGFPLSVRGRPRPEIDKAVADMLDLVHLGAYAGRRPSELSGGQQQRVALARALVYRPRLLLMDEPLSALDKRLREDIQQEIRRIHRELGVTILYVTHDQEEALRLSDRIAVFSQGRIAQIGTGADLYERPANAFVAGFVGNSNLLRGEVVDVTGGVATVRLADGSVIRGMSAAGIAQGCAAEIMVRPERLLPPGAEDGGPTADQAIKGIIIDQSYLGEVLQYEIRTAWQQNLLIRDSRRMSPNLIGSEACFSFRHQDALVFPA